MKGCTPEMAQPTPERWLDLIDNVEDAFCRFKKVRCKFKMMKKSFFKVEEEDGNERVVEPQRTLPVHARCQVIPKIDGNYAHDDAENYDDDVAWW